MKKHLNKTKTARGLFNRMVNVTSDEWPRIYLSWSMQFLYRTSYIIGWTALIALFVTTYGLLMLPYFFVIYSLAKMVSAYIFSHLINKFPKDRIIMYTSLIGATLFFLVSMTRIISPDLFLFLSIIIFGMIISQLYILNSGFIEDLFTPLESERTFPIIESAETIGGIIGGLLIAFLAPIIPTENFITILVISLALLAPIMLFQRYFLKKIPYLAHKKNRGSHFKFTNIKDFFENIKLIPFLKVLFIIVIAQWFITNMLEFQFTKAIFQNIPANAIHPEQELTHGLGSLHIFFYTFGLFMQILIASRILGSLGVTGSLLLHPVVTLLSLGAMLFRFGLPSAILAKLNFEMTTIIHKNAYHTSYYAIDPKMREQVRELLEGFAHPLGTLLSMFLILGFQFLLTGSALNTSMTVMMIAVMGFMLIILLKNENQYTKLSIKNLTQSVDSTLQLNAIEILGQKGHKNAVNVLTKTLKKADLENKVTIKILNTLGHIKEHDSILDILNYISHEDRRIRFAAIKALNNYDVIRKKQKSERPFSLFRINNVLKRQFQTESDEDIKALIIKILAKLNKHKIVPYLIDLLKSADPTIQANCISACYYFNDINLIHYLLPFIDSPDPMVRAHTIIALWKYDDYKKHLTTALKSMLHSKNSAVRIEAYMVIGKVKAHLETNRLISTLSSVNKTERLVAALALANLGKKEGNEIIVDILIHSNATDREIILHRIDSLSKTSKSKIEALIRQKVSAFINESYLVDTDFDIEALDRLALIKLRNAYELVNEHEEVQNINKLLINLNPS